MLDAADIRMLPLYRRADKQKETRRFAGLESVSSRLSKRLVRISDYPESRRGQRQRGNRLRQSASAGYVERRQLSLK